MTEHFDPYHELLGIPPQEQPPNHYRLLGISLWETNRQVIANAAMQRSKFLRSLGISQYGDVCQRLLNEVSAAKICLLNETKKAAYDRQFSHAGPVPPPPPSQADQPAVGPATAAGTAEQVSPPPTSYRAVLSQGAPAATPAGPPRAEPPPPVESPPIRNAPPTAVLRDWILGAAPGCDVVVDVSAVSGIHCRLSKTADGCFWIEDLDSTNGTYVNHVPIAGKVQVTRYDRITLGKKTPQPWPADADVD